MMKSIRTKLTAAAVLGIIVISLIMGGMAFHFQRQSSSQETEKTLQALAEECAGKLALQLEMLTIPLEMLAMREEMENDTLNQALLFLQGEHQRLPYETLGIIDHAGVLHYIDGTTLPLDQIQPLQRMVAQEWMVTDVFSCPRTRQPAIGMLVPVHANTAFAYLYGQKDGLLPMERIQPARYGGFGTAYVINHEGAFQVYPRNPDMVVRQETVASIVAQQDHLATFGAFVEQALANPGGAGRYQAGDAVVYMGHATVPDTNWVFFAGAFEERFMGALLAFQEGLYPALFILLLIGVLGAALLASHFTKPVAHLDRIFTKAAAGDLTVRSAIKTRDEMGSASRSFNQMMDRINELTYYDPVTDLPNHQVLKKHFREMMTGTESTTQEDGKTGSTAAGAVLAIFGADGFSRVNDQMGYQKGNLLLRMAGQRIQQNIPDNARLYRGQSDELVLLMSSPTEPATPGGDWLGHIQQLQESLSRPYLTDTETATLSFSAGIAKSPEHGHALDELMKNAGLAKNMAKRRGPGQLQQFTMEIRKEALEIHRMEEDLKGALARNEFHLVYQPVVQLESGAPRGMEALLRWTHSQEGLIPPGIFIPIAERMGIIREIGQWVLKEACRQHTAWQQQGMGPLTMAVNISILQFEEEDFVPGIASILEETGMAPGLLELELTESAVIHQVDESVEKLKQLRQMGIKVSIDDFGTGYSSLSYMVRLPVDTLKIDRSFIDSMINNRQAQAIVATIMEMGRALGLQLVAEGIETEAQLRMMKQNGCQLGQGFYFSRPLPPEQLLPYTQKPTR